MCDKGVRKIISFILRDLCGYSWWFEYTRGLVLGRERRVVTTNGRRKEIGNRGEIDRQARAGSRKREKKDIDSGNDQGDPVPERDQGRGAEGYSGDVGRFG